MHGNHIICLTIDTDPDGLMQVNVNRNDMDWAGLGFLLPKISAISERVQREVPITWFLRIDNQVADHFGSPCHLFNLYEKYWGHFIDRGHEVAWHPHLYVLKNDNYEIMHVPGQIRDTLNKLWKEIRTETPLQIRSFRNGEGWMSPTILNTLAELGIEIDSTAIPGIFRTDGHPMNWKGTTNEIYYPDFDIPNVEGPQRDVIEFPMSTWYVKAPYDKQARMRYINPAVHHSIFKEAVLNLEISEEGVTFWNFIFHPSEILPKKNSDLLYANDLNELFENIKLFSDFIEGRGGRVEFKTIESAVNLWKHVKRG